MAKTRALVCDADGALADAEVPEADTAGAAAALGRLVIPADLCALATGRFEVNFFGAEWFMNVGLVCGTAASLKDDSVVSLKTETACASLAA